MTVPDLGFGTAPILGRISRRAGVAALEAAWDAGIRHFDTARSYGWGDAEAVLGSVLSKHRREEYRIVGKCGIVPAKRSRVMQLAKSVGRAVIKVVPALRKTARNIGSAGAFAPQFSADVNVLKDSFATSLRELGTPYIDVLLLHNYEPGMSGLDDVGDWFRGLQRDGKIRRFGFSVEGRLIEGLEDLDRQGLLAEGVVQTPVSAELLALEDKWRGTSFIAHSPFRFLGSGSSAQGLGGGLGDLLVRLDKACRCEALVCSMYDRAHLAANVAAWQAARNVKTA